MKFAQIVFALGIVLLVMGGVEANQGAKGKFIAVKDSQAAKLFARAKEDDFMGSDGCKDCHSSQAESFPASGHAAFMHDPKAPLNKQGCEGCHGPGFIHQAEENAEVIAFRKMSPAESSAACLRCHETSLPETHWKRTEHANADLSCVSCHQIHPDSKPNFVPGSTAAQRARDPKQPLVITQAAKKALLMADEATLCGQCHAPTVAQFQMSSHHPIPEGQMVCSDCHSVHPAKMQKARLTLEKGTCLTCHTEFAGPFAFEHDPVAGHTGEGCVECHKPHGSNNPKMLSSFSRGVCAQCHTEKLVSHYPGRTCWTAGCHVAQHGSNSSPNFLEP